MIAGRHLRRLVLCCLPLLFCLPTAGRTDSAETATVETLVIAAFSSAHAGGEFPEGWRPLTFDNIARHTRYDLVEDAGTVVVRAVSEGAASGLTRKIRFDPHRYPVVRWRWKVDTVYRKGDVTRKTGDDYPARLYITFLYDPDRAGFIERATFEAARLAYGEYPPMGAISYIWASKAPVGGVFSNPYTDRVKMIVVRSGAVEAGRWHTETRNLREDYRAAFGEDPPRVGGVAVMTDSDNTGETATAWYGDISFLAE